MLGSRLRPIVPNQIAFPGAVRLSFARVSGLFASRERSGARFPVSGVKAIKPLAAAIRISDLSVRKTAEIGSPKPTLRT